MRKGMMRWIPAVLIMGVMFIFSSIPSTTLPHFDWADILVKKGGHALGYGLLALAYFHALRPNRGACQKVDRKYLWIAGLLAIVYALTDEFHQSFTPGRRPSLLDVLIDACGAAVALFFLQKRCRAKE